MDAATITANLIPIPKSNHFPSVFIRGCHSDQTNQLLILILILITAFAFLLRAIYGRCDLLPRRKWHKRLRMIGCWWASATIRLRYGL
jgi:hypothetical protein